MKKIEAFQFGPQGGFIRYTDDFVGWVDQPLTERRPAPKIALTSNGYERKLPVSHGNRSRKDR